MYGLSRDNYHKKCLFMVHIVHQSPFRFQLFALKKGF